MSGKRGNGFRGSIFFMSSNPFSRIGQDRAIMDRSITYLRDKSRILFLTTSNRWIGEKNDLPKSTLLARKMAEQIGDKVTIIDVTTLKIYPCEGNVSTSRGNTCGEKGALLEDKEKDPSGCHRCYASLNNPDDELWKISKILLAADAVVFFGSVRWGQMNAFYQKLIERLTWLENRHSTLGEENILKEIDAGLIVIGHNWRGSEILDAQKQVHGFFGFKTPDALYWNWSYTNPEDESNASYVDAGKAFRETFL